MFKSTEALINALVATQKVTKENVQKISLGDGEWMIVDKTNPTVALGYSTVTYLGIFPGFGKKFSCDARFA